MLFITNASNIKDGIPACVCYYKAGIENGYKMRHGSKTFTKMDLDDCTSVNMPKDYFYMSNVIYKRGVNKIKKHFSKKKN